ncbi:hypothetical protein DsansV1_C20g0165421 [Dioscorea sansibarensis]
MKKTKSFYWFFFSSALSKKMSSKYLRHNFRRSQTLDSSCQAIHPLSIEFTYNSHSSVQVSDAQMLPCHIYQKRNIPHSLKSSRLHTKYLFSHLSPLLLRLW